MGTSRGHQNSTKKKAKIVLAPHKQVEPVSPLKTVSSCLTFIHKGTSILPQHQIPMFLDKPMQPTFPTAFAFQAALILPIGPQTAWPGDAGIHPPQHATHRRRARTLRARCISEGGVAWSYPWRWWGKWDTLQHAISSAPKVYKLVFSQKRENMGELN